jgi:DNA-binding NarL/FixJ family response regulator
VSVRVLLADDYPVIRQAIKLLLEQEGFRVVAEAGNGREALELVLRHRPDIAVLDIAMPQLSGLDAGRKIVCESPQTRVILLTILKEDEFVLKAIQYGIRGFVMKGQTAQDLFEAIREVSRGGTYIGPDTSKAVFAALRAGSTSQREALTPRERQVVQLVAEGKTTKEVAVDLGIRVKTVVFHRTRVMDKLNIHNTAGLVRYAIRHGLISP